MGFTPPKDNIKKSELILVIGISSGQDALGSDQFDIYECARLPGIRIIHWTGVAAGWEIDKYSCFDLTAKNKKYLDEILETRDVRLRYSLVKRFEEKDISVDQG